MKNHVVASASDHRLPDGRFRNPWPGVVEHGFADVLRWYRERRTRPGASAPPPTFPTVAPSFSHPRADPAALSATWVGHSTVLVQLGTLNVLTDPMWGERASPFRWIGPRRWAPPGVALDALPPIDLVLLSHNHYDHLDAPTVRALAARHPEAHWVAPLGLTPLLRRLGVRRISELDWWDEVTVGAARVACTPAQHFSDRGLTDRMRTLWCGWAVRTETHALFFAGDTGLHPLFSTIGQAYGPFDLSLLPIGAYDPRWFMRPVHMDPEEAAQAFRDLCAPHPHHAARPPVALGIHWGTFKLTDEPMDEPPARARAAWRAAGFAPEQLWILQHGETRWAGAREPAAAARRQAAQTGS